MIVTVIFKTPDAGEYARESLDAYEREAFDAVFQRFVRYDEQITVRFDTEAKTATVVARID